MCENEVIKSEMLILYKEEMGTSIQRKHGVQMKVAVYEVFIKPQHGKISNQNFIDRARQESRIRIFPRVLRMTDSAGSLILSCQPPEP